MTVTVSICQPNYLPWLGLFDMMKKADVHVYYDDEQFSRKGWANRNRVRGADGKPTWLSVPVAHGQAFPKLCETGFAAHGKPFRQDHPNKLAQWYRDAPNLEVLAGFRAVLHEPHQTLADLNIAVIEWMAHLLRIETPTQRSSLMDVPEHLDTTYRPLEVCKRLGADRFICGPTAKAYIDQPVFERNGIEIVWHEYEHPTYWQSRPDFVSHLSALDYLLEHGAGWPGETAVIYGPPVEFV